MKTKKSSIGSIVVIALLISGATSLAATGQDQKTTLNSFSGTSTKLTSSQKKQIASALKTNSDANQIVCTAFVVSNAKADESKRAKARANATCNYVKSLNQDISVSVESKSSKSKSLIGKVVLTFGYTSSSPAEAAGDSTFSPSIDPLSAKQIQLRAMQEVSKNLQKVATASQFEFYASADYPKAILSENLVIIDRTLRYFAEQQNLSKVDAIFFTQQSGEWAQSKWEQIVAGSSIAGKIKIYIPERNNDYGRALVYKVGSELRGIIYMNSFGKPFPDLPAHEVVHLFQRSAHKAPNWLVEGSATFYGSALGYLPTKGEALKIRTDANLKRVLLGPEPEVINLFKKYEVQNPSSAGSSYTLGCMLFTILVGRFGEEKAWQFQQMFDSGEELRSGFQRIYGMTLDDFYILALPTVRELAQAN